MSPITNKALTPAERPARPKPHFTHEQEELTREKAREMQRDQDRQQGKAPDKKEK